MSRILTKSLRIAEKNINRDVFSSSFTDIEDTSYTVETKIQSGFFFNDEKSHLIIKRVTPSSIFIDIYSKNSQKFHRVLSHEHWAITYKGDTIFDVNGDGLRDFVVNWYGATGCCLKGFSDVYLLRKDKQTFSRQFQFINPTFSPKEMIIRGLGYGHPEETEIYKFQWNGEKVDSLEYIFYEKNDKGEKTGRISVSRRSIEDNKFHVVQSVSKIPEEYLKIEGIDWFTGNLESK